jgi:uncharacterized delta-60 repeat protein
MKNRKLPLLGQIIFLSVFLISNFNQTTNAQNQAGMPDPNFGTNGQVITTSPDNLGNITLQDFVLQPDGKILAVGRHVYVGMQTSFVRFLLVRYNPDGSLDQTFGNNGISSTDFGGVAVTHSVALQANGKILVGGEFFPRVLGRADRNDAILARFNSDGSLDNSFGDNGAVIVDLAFFEEVSNEDIRKVIALADGKILTVGLKYSRHAAHDDLWIGSTAILRFTADGTLDNNFGRQGKVISNVLSVSETPGTAVLTGDGKLLISALADYKNAQYRFILARYNLDGSVDTSFAAGGALAFNRQDLIENQFSVADGQIYLRLAPNLFLYNADGSLNRMLVGQNQLLFALRNFTLQPDGKIIISGDTFQTGNYRVGIARFHPNGQIDTSFGVNGSFTKPMDFQVTTVKAILQPDGKMLIGANGLPNGSTNFVLYRFLGDAQFADWNNNSKRRKQSAP